MNYYQVKKGPLHHLVLWSILNWLRELTVKIYQGVAIVQNYYRYHQI